jgi:hypothetical protein
MSEKVIHKYAHLKRGHHNGYSSIIIALCGYEESPRDLGSIMINIKLVTCDTCLSLYWLRCLKQLRKND